MIKKLAFCLATALTIASVTSCNSDDPQQITSASSSAAVTSFSLAENKKVLENLDSVFFSIDLVRGEIFNADSLPFGTRINRLIPVITTGGASVAQLTVSRPGQTDTIIDYLANSTDSIDFSNGPVKLRIVSPDGTTERNYSISVNVHQVKPDSLVWSMMERRALPSIFQVPNEQHTTVAGSTYYCLTRYGSRYCMASATAPEGEWTKSEISFPFTPDIKSLTGTTQMLVILDTDGNLHSSADKGATWQPSGEKFNCLYGSRGPEVIGSRLENGQWLITTYPCMLSLPMPEGFPVSGTSVPVDIDFNNGLAVQTLLTGGRLADGSLSSQTWGFDGSTWAPLSSRPLPVGLESPCVVAYYISDYNELVWTPERTPVLLAFGGRKADGSLNRTVYYSVDYGVRWDKAPQLVQLPEQVPSMCGAQAYVHNITCHADAGQKSSAWKAVELPKLPVWASMPLPALNPIGTMATAPITEWEAPYIFMFGGLDAAGTTTYNTMWRGVITRFTFKPVQ